jgi:hypothetical protein
MNTGHPISSAYLILGALFAIAIVFALALLLTMLFRGPVPLPLDPGLPFPAYPS